MLNGLEFGVLIIEIYLLFAKFVFLSNFNIPGFA